MDTSMCWQGQCTVAPVAQWSRRPTRAELDGAEQGQLTVEESRVAVHGCPEHVITLDLATLVHADTCVAPDLALLPACGCKPEPLPMDSRPTAPAVTLATGWTVPAPLEV
jgi:hypothetical protein